MPPWLGGREIPPSDGPPVPGSGAGRLVGILPEPMPPEPIPPGAGRVSEPDEPGSLMFGRVEGDCPPRLPGAGRVRFDGGVMFEMPPGAGRVVGTPPPRLGRLVFMLLPMFGFWILPGMGRDKLPGMLPMLPLGRERLPGRVEGPAGLACGIELPNDGRFIGIWGAGLDIGIEGRDIPPMLGMLGRAPPPLKPAPPRFIAPPPPPPRMPPPRP
jgi:hypothetical protein